MFIAVDSSPSFDIDAWGWFYLPSDSESLGLPREHRSVPSQLNLPSLPSPSKPRPDLLQRIEFALVFQNTPVNGVNHAKAPPQDQFTYLFPDTGELYFETDYISNTTNLAMTWTSYPISYPNGTFSNMGSISLNSETTVIASLNFTSSTLGQERNGPNAGDAYGGITYWINSGFGLWQGANGVMVDIFRSPNDATENPIMVWGIFWI